MLKKNGDCFRHVEKALTATVVIQRNRTTRGYVEIASLV